jgi:hypothetical protein
MTRRAVAIFLMIQFLFWMGPVALCAVSRAGAMKNNIAQSSHGKHDCCPRAASQRAFERIRSCGADHSCCFIQLPAIPAQLPAISDDYGTGVLSLSARSMQGEAASPNLRFDLSPEFHPPQLLSPLGAVLRI